MSEPIVITDPEDPRVAVYRDIRERDLVGRQGLFVAEGEVVLLDADCCDPLYRKAIRVSVGAALVTPFARFARDDDPVSILETAGFQPLALSPSGAEVLARTRIEGRVAVLLGSEGPGLSPDVMTRARTVRIPMAGAFDSLNVATTSAVVLHHLADRAMYGA